MFTYRTTIQLIFFMLLDMYTHTQKHSLCMFLFKYAALEQQGLAVREKLERRVAELQKKLAQQDSSGDTAAEVRIHTRAHENGTMKRGCSTVILFNFPSSMGCMFITVKITE